MKQAQKPIPRNLLSKNKTAWLTILLFYIGTHSLWSQYLWQIYPDTVIKWNYYNGDEFNKKEVDQNKWIRNLPWSRAVLSQDIYYLDSNVAVNNGNVQFYLKQESKLFSLQPWEMDSTFLQKNKAKLIDGDKFPFKYTGGLLWSKQQYKYGYFEIKFKAATGQGIWPAFWLYGGNPNNEIDFMELKGEKEVSVHVDIHCKDGCSNYITGWFGYRKAFGHWVKVKEPLNEGYNIISGEWTPNYIKWFLNGILIAYSKQSINISMNLTAGTGIAKNGGAFKPGPNLKTPFPNEFDVDYIRVYKTDTIPNYNEIKTSMSDSLFANNLSTDLLNAPKNNLKLKGGVNHKLYKNLITFSIMQVSKNALNVRILGVTQTDTCLVIISDIYDNEIQKIYFNQSREVIMPIKTIDKIKIHAEINHQVINEEALIHE